MTTPQALLAEAGKHLEAFDFASAAALYNQVLETHPENAAALMGLALVCNRSGKNREALEILRRIWTALEAGSPEQQTVVQPSTRAEILAQIGLALQLLDHMDEAIPFYKRANDLHPSEHLQRRIDAHANKGSNATPFARLVARARKLDTQGKSTEAIDTYQQALKLNPDSDVAQHGLGDLYRRTGALAKAMPLIQHAIIMQPKVAEYHNTLGMLFQQRGEFEKALLFHRRALAIDSNYAAAHCNLGVALKNLNRLEDAAQEYCEALRIDPNIPEAHNNLGNVYRILGKVEEAHASLSRALKLRPDYADAQQNLLALQAVTGATRSETANLEQTKKRSTGKATSARKPKK